MSKTVTPEEAKALLDQGYVYVDVRSEQEFESGHPAGALNVPISFMGPGGLEPIEHLVQLPCQLPQLVALSAQ